MSISNDLKTDKMDIMIAEKTDKLSRKLDSFGGVNSEIEKDRVSEAFRRYIAFHGFKSAGQISTRDLKYLSYGFARKDLVADIPLIASNESTNIFDLLWRYPRSAYIGPVLRAAFLHWETLLRASNCWDSYVAFMRMSLSNYSGRNPQYNAIRENIEFLVARDGPERLGAFIAREKNSPMAVIRDFGFPSSLIPLEYFDRVMMSYCRLRESLEFENVPEIAERAELSQSREVRLIIVSFLLLKTNIKASEIRDFVQTTAVKLIGDPQYQHKWRLRSNRFTHFEKDVERARILLAGWINENIVMVFFTKLSESRQFNRNRLEFWRKYVKSIPLMKIAASKNQLSQMSGLDLADDLLKSRIIMVDGDSSPAAILFRTANNLLIEFGKQNNAMYCYRSDHNNYALFEMDTIRSTLNMKNTSFPVISNNRMTQGRKFHNEGWQYDFERWLKNAIGVKHD